MARPLINHIKPSYDEEPIWLPAVRWGRVIERYSVSHFGTVWDNHRSRFVVDGVRLRGKNKGNKDFTVHLCVPHELFSGVNNGFSYKKTRNYDMISVAVHRLVMETHRPLTVWYKHYLRPEMVKDIDRTKEVLSPERLRVWLEQFVVDHIDSNINNNHVDNLRWCTSADNQAHRKAHSLGLKVDGYGRPINGYNAAPTQIEEYATLEGSFEDG